MSRRTARLLGPITASAAISVTGSPKGAGAAEVAVSPGLYFISSIADADGLVAEIQATAFCLPADSGGGVLPAANGRPAKVRVRGPRLLLTGGDPAVVGVIPSPGPSGAAVMVNGAERIVAADCAPGTYTVTPLFCAEHKRRSRACGVSVALR
jgi:hypothetical protein